VIGTGDNYYSNNETELLNDRTWDEHWTSIYGTKPHLSKLNWYGVMGNKDYTNKWLEAEFIFRKNGWRIDDFFWSHKIENIVFVHIDTSFLAYGANGETGNE